MPNYGRLGNSTPAANTETKLYLGPANTKGLGNLWINNKNTSSVLVSYAITATDTGAGTDDWLDTDMVIPAKGSPSPQINGIVVGAGQTLRVKSNTANVTFVFNGQEAAV